MRTSFTLGEIFSEAEIAKARELWQTLNGTGKFANSVSRLLVQPKLAHIEQVLGMEMDALYIAYAIEHIFMQEGKLHTVKITVPTGVKMTNVRTGEVKTWHGPLTTKARRNDAAGVWEFRWLDKPFTVPISEIT